MKKLRQKKTLEEKKELIKIQEQKAKKLKEDLRKEIEKSIINFFDFREDDEMIAFIEENQDNKQIKDEVRRKILNLKDIKEKVGDRENESNGSSSNE